MKSTVAEIVDNKLCLGCGTCEGICPPDAISMVYSSTNRTYIPHINDEKCTSCSLCYQVCPGLHMLIHQSRDISQPNIKSTPLLGEYMQCFTGYASDEKVRHNATSGGIATALSLFLLESGKVDAVVAATMSKNSPFDTEPLVCRSRADIISAMGSKYCPTATNTCLKDINTHSTKSALFIGLPCHIQGINNAKQKEPLSRMDTIITMGLLCGGMKGQEGTRWILKSRNILIDDVATIAAYRSDGSPGKMIVSLKGRSDPVIIPFPDFYDEYFESWRPRRCNLCLDRTAALADISLGDAWLPEFKDDVEGTSIIVARTAKGCQVIREAIADNRVKARETDGESIGKSQAGLRDDLHHNVLPSLFLAKALGKKIPGYGIPIANPGASKLLTLLRNQLRSALLRKMTNSHSFYTILRAAGTIKRMANHSSTQNH